MLHTNNLYYNLKIEWEYQAPNDYFTWKWTINIPSGNTENVKFYYAMDTYIAGDDANDAGFYDAGSQSLGVFDTVDKFAMKFRVLS